MVLSRSFDWEECVYWRSTTESNHFTAQIIFVMLLPCFLSSSHFVFLPLLPFIQKFDNFMIRSYLCKTLSVDTKLMSNKIK